MTQSDISSNGIRIPPWIALILLGMFSSVVAWLVSLQTTIVKVERDTVRLSEVEMDQIKLREKLFDLQLVDGKALEGIKSDLTTIKGQLDEIRRDVRTIQDSRRLPAKLQSSGAGGSGEESGTGAGRWAYSDGGIRE